MVLPALGLLACKATADPVDDFIRSEMQRQRIPGITLAVVRDGQVIKTGAYGKADLELDVDAKIENVFEIGSVTKQFTAVLALLLAEEGKLSLEDPVSKYVDDAPAAWEKITLRHLLSHTSGLKEYVVIPGLMLHEEFDQATFLEKVRPLDLDFQPGVTFAYSNTGFALLRIVLEKAGGKAYGDLLKEKILEPLSMGQTRMLNPLEIVPHRAHGYWHVQDQLLRTRQSVLAGVADGAILSTVGDLVKWDAALHGGKLLSPDSYRQLIEPNRLNSGRTRNYGLGTFRQALGAVPSIGHHGNSPGYSAGYSHFPSARLSVMVLGNVYAFNGQTMTHQIAMLVEPSLRPARLADAASDPDSARTASFRTALDRLAAGEVDGEYLEEEFAAPMKTDRARLFPNPYAGLRQLQELRFVSEEAMDRDTLLTYRLMMPNDRMLIASVVWSPEGKIANLSLRPDQP
jgi:D-alanyl-D-alanine carboxypeptidase